jgi:hypothetical protein
MILVAGLAIAGLAGIAAAFYFSVRPGTAPDQRTSRVRATGTGRTPANRPPADRSRTSAPPSRSGRAEGRSRPEPDDDFGGPSRYHPDPEHFVAGRGARGRSSGPGADQPAPVGAQVAGAGSQPRRAAQPDWEADTTAEAAKGARSRLRVGWRKGSEVDEELWPTETFGGVSDEQFWDDLASDKPLATTARTANAAQPDSASRRRLPDAVPGPDGRGGAGPGRGDNGRIAGGSGAYRQPAIRPGPADRTVIQPVKAGPQAIHTGPQPVQPATTPAPVVPRSYQPATQPQPYQAAAPSYQTATQPAPIAGQGGRPGLPAAPRGRARSANGTDLGLGGAAGEDPLTSAAYSLRPRGAVDGRSYQSSRRSRELSRERYDTAISQETQSFSLGDAQAATGGYPGGLPPLRQYELPPGGGNGRAPEPRPDATRYDGLGHGGLGYHGLGYDGLRTDPLRSDAYWSGGRADPLRGQGAADAYGGTAGYPYPERPYSDPARSSGPPQYGEIYGYGYPASPVDDPRQPSSTRGQARSGGNGAGSWDPRQAYPAGNGYRSPYDPRGNGRG